MLWTLCCLRKAARTTGSWSNNNTLTRKAKGGLIYNLQLEAAVAMFFRAHDVPVRLIHATKRCPFLGLDGWKQNTRHERKKRVVAAVKKLLCPEEPDNQFARRPHDLTAWDGLANRGRHDVANATMWRTP